MVCAGSVFLPIGCGTLSDFAPQVWYERMVCALHGVCTEGTGTRWPLGLAGAILRQVRSRDTEHPERPIETFPAGQGSIYQMMEAGKTGWGSAETRRSQTPLYGLRDTVEGQSVWSSRGSR